jgi:S-sulfo-L-cysteine synthase (O-acetyl-L-serine-dependent)
MAGTSPKLRLIRSPAKEPKKAESVLDFIGDTPLLQISRVAEGLPSGVRIFAKLEGFNPGGSVKDRPALRMVQEGIRAGKLRPGKTILDSTSGNTGIALAMIGRVLGYPVELVVPANVSMERKQIMQAYGAKVTYSDPMEGSDGAIRECRKILEKNPDKYFKPDQYFNPMNPQAHYETTGPEIYRQTGGEVTHFIAGIGTGGTIMGAGRYFKEVNPKIRVIAVEPDDALHGLEGLKHMASSIVPGIYHEEELDEKFPASTDDAYAMVYRLSQEEGLLVGQSSGAAMFAALKIARKLRSGTLVTIFPDFGDKYLSTNLWIGWRDRMAVGNLEFNI